MPLSTVASFLTHTIASPPSVAAPRTEVTALEEGCVLVEQHGLKHIGFIMDGNRRWAKQQQLPTLVGHQQGSERLKELIRYANAIGLTGMTCYSFSTENWKRSHEEIDYLFTLMTNVLRKELGELCQLGVRVRYFGDRASVPAALLAVFHDAEARTANNTGLTLQLAINYSGRHHLLQAVQQVAHSVQSGQLQPTEIDEQHIEALLNPNQLPPPDVIIRPGGEQRLSNFMLWESAYSELMFTPTLWPEFDVPALLECLRTYGQRQRRFGI